MKTQLQIISTHNWIHDSNEEQLMKLLDSSVSCGGHFEPAPPPTIKWRETPFEVKQKESGSDSLLSPSLSEVKLSSGSVFNLN